MLGHGYTYACALLFSRCIAGYRACAHKSCVLSSFSSVSVAFMQHRIPMPEGDMQFLRELINPTHNPTSVQHIIH
jgi:hypothetical protein